MRKFLSILMLACLLAVGMSLPAAAEGGSLSTLYVKATDETGKPDIGITVPTGIVRDVQFYTKEGTDYLEVEATPVVADSTIAEVNKTGNGYTIKGLKLGETTVFMRDDNGAITTNVKILVPQSSLEVSIDGGRRWDTTVKNDLSTEVSYPVQFRFGANAPNIPGAETVFVPCDLEEIIVDPASGLVLQDGAMIATKIGQYTLSYEKCSVLVNVAYQGSADITVDELGNLKKSHSECLDFLRTKGYSGNGSFTLRLPETSDSLDSVECSNGLTDGTLTLKGAANGTSITNLKISAENIAVDDITLNSIQLHNVKQFEARNCIFSDVPYHIYTGSSGDAPTLMLTGNTYRATDFANIYDEGDTLVGTWRLTGASEPEGTVWDLGHYEWYKSGSQVQAFEFDVADSLKTLSDKGWKFEFRHPSSFTSAYSAFAKDGTAYDGEFEANSDPKTYVMSISEDGKYAIISGSYPSFSDGNVVLSAVDAKYLDTVTVDTTYANAVVTLGSTQVLSSINNNKLTFSVKGPGTYKVTATTTSSGSTGSSVQKRTYKYTYQDYYQVTPAGFTNAMRYVKDNLVTLNCTEAGTRSISLPVASMAAAAEKGYSVLVKTKNAELTLDAAALKSMAQQAKGTTVLLHYKSLNHKTLTTVGQASIQSHLAQCPGDNADLAFLVTATSDSETIEDLQMGTITLKIPFILLPGTEGMANTVYALQSESIAEARETTVAEGHLTTKLLDLTEHMVFLTTQAPQPTVETTEATGETTEPTEETIVETTQPETVPETTQPAQPVEAEKQGGSLILTLVIVLGVVLVIGGGALGFLILRRRSRK